MLGLTMGTGGDSSLGDRLPALLLSGIFNTLLGLIMFGFHDRFGNAAR
jgi:hypothetical protein